MPVSNDFSNLFQNILKFGAIALRQNAITPRLVSQDFGPEEAQKGQIINVSIPRAKVPTGVTPGTVQDGDDRAHDLHPILMDQWRTVGFSVTDKEEREVFEQGVLPADASEAIKALMNEVDNYIIGKMAAKFPYQVGDTGAVDSIDHIVDNRTQLVKNLAPMAGLNYMMNPDTEGAMLKIGTFHQADQSGNLSGLQEGNLGRKFGFQMFMNQNLTGKTITTGTRTTTTVIDVTGTNPIGSTSVVVKTGTGAVVLGDTFSVAGDPNVYIVQAPVADITAAPITYFPPNKVAWADDAVLTFGYIAQKLTTYHALGFHPMSFGFVNRPLRVARSGLGVITAAVTDPVTGLSLRLEVTRVNKEDTWSWDILYGGDVIRPELGVFSTQEQA